MATAKTRRRQAANLLFVIFCGVATAIALVFLGAILYSLLKQGLGGVNLAVFTQSTPAPGSPGGSARSASPTWPGSPASPTRSTRRASRGRAPR